MHLMFATILLMGTSSALDKPTMPLDDDSVLAYSTPDHMPYPKLGARFFQPGMKAQVRMEFQINPKGYVDWVRLIDKQPFDLDQAPFLDAVAARTYLPSAENEQRYPVIVTTEFTAGGVSVPAEH